MEKEIKMLPGKKRRSMPVALRGLIALSVAAVLCTVGLLLILRDRKISPFPSANTVSEYLTTKEDSVSLNDATPRPSLAAFVPKQTPTPVPTDSHIVISHYSTLQLNDDNAEVSALQQKLMDLGYMEADDPGTLYNESTRNAVTLFQRATDTEQNGIASAALQEMLFSDDAQEYRIKLDDSGADVKSVQRQLRDLGYYSDRITGYYGPNTEDAVRAFQAKNDKEIDGQITRDDWDLLYSDNAIPLATPTPEPTPTPTPTPTPKPTKSPTPRPSKTPTPKPTKTPTPKPTKTASANPSKTATPKPTKTPTPKPTATKKPTATPKPTKTPKPTNTPKPTKTPKPTNTPKPTKTPSSGDDSGYSHSVDGVISCAKNQLGDPYVLGDEGPDSFDCSGLVYYCLKKAGVSVSRRSAHSYSENDSWKRIDSIDDLKRGDLLFFNSKSSDRVNHTAIYIGSGSFIHASSSKGEVVKSSFSSYWYEHFVCGRRVFD